MSTGNLRMTVAGSKAIGYEYDEESRDPVIGEDPTIRPGTIIYNDVVIGDRFTTGHFGLVRERTEIGDDVVVGTNVTIDGPRPSARTRVSRRARTFPRRVRSAITSFSDRRPS